MKIIFSTKNEQLFEMSKFLIGFTSTELKPFIDVQFKIQHLRLIGQSRIIHRRP